MVHSRNNSLTHDSASGQIRLPDDQESISSSHAEIKVVQAEYVVQDVGSLNGTWLDGRRLSEERAVGELAPLRHGSLLRIGKHEFTVRFVTLSQDEPTSKPQPGLNRV